MGYPPNCSEKCAMHAVTVWAYAYTYHLAINLRNIRRNSGYGDDTLHLLLSVCNYIIYGITLVLVMILLCIVSIQSVSGMIYMCCSKCSVTTLL